MTALCLATHRGGRYAFAALCTLAFACTPLHAQELDAIEQRLSVRLGVAHSDNLGRDADAALVESETFAVIGLDIGATRENRRMAARIDGGADYHRYDSDRFPNETLGQLSAGLDIRIVPSMFTWEFANELGHMRRDSFRAPSPENRDRLNVFGTGPVLAVPVGEASTFGFSARHEERKWRDSDELDSTSQYADLNLFRTLNQVRRIGMTLSGRRTEYDTAAAAPFDVHMAYMTYERTLIEGSFSVSAGANRLRNAGGSESSPFYTASLRRRVAAYSTLLLSVSRQIEDAADQLGGGRFAESVDGIGDVPLTGAPLVLTRTGLDYSLARPRATYSVGGDWSRQRFADAPELDRNGWQGRLSASYRFSRGTRGDLVVGYGRERFGQSLGESKTKTAEAALVRQLSRTLSLRFLYRYDDRDTEFDRDFSENSYRLSLEWAPR